MHFNHPKKSAFIDLVMKDDTEAERQEATRHWVDFLEAIIKIVDEDERQKPQHKTSTPIDEADILPIF